MAELRSERASEAIAAPEAYAVTNLAVDAKEVYARGRTDINFFAAVLLPSVMVSPLPPFYVAIFHLLVNRTPEDAEKVLRFALGLPRAHAKTTFVKILVAWFIVYDRFSFIAVICATDDLAQNFIGDVSDALASSNAQEIYGYWDRQLSTDNKEEKQALYHGRHIILKARGFEGSVRGLNIKHKRPELIVFDDAQTKEGAESEVENKKFRARFTATIKLIAPVTQLSARLIIFVGNMYNEVCLLYRLKKSAGWTSLITGAILEDGNPLWPELHSLEELRESYVHDESLDEADVWFAEVMNDPISRATSLLTKPLGTSDFLSYEELPDGVFLTIDPAGFRDAADDNVIVTHYVHDGKGIVAGIVSSGTDIEITDPEKLILRALQIALESGASLIGVEDTAYQQTLLFWFTKYITALKIEGIAIVPLKPAGRSKEARIRLFIAETYAGNWSFLSEPKSVFVWQAMNYKMGAKKNKDDILDACAYSLDVRNEYWHLITNLKKLGTFALTGEAARVVGSNTPF